MPNKVTRRPMFRGRVEPRNPMGILASSQEMVGAVQRAKGGMKPVYAQTGFFNQAQAQPVMGIGTMGNVQPNQAVRIGPDINQIVRDAQKQASDVQLPGQIGVVGQQSGTGIAGVFSQDESPSMPNTMNVGLGSVPTIKDGDKVVTPGKIINASMQTEGQAKDTPPKDSGRKSVSEAISDTINAPNALKTELEARAAGTSGTTKKQQDILSEQNTALTDLQGKAAAETARLTGKIDEIAAKKGESAVTLQGIVDKFEQQKIDPKTARDEVSFASVYEDTVKEMGYDADNLDAAYEDEKTQSFWLSVMKAGLAVAAGEDANALTNLAKGMMFGLESWGQDMQRLNAQEREDRKEFRTALRQNLKSEKDMAVALATNANSTLATQLNLEMQVANAQSDAEIAVLNAELQKSSQVFANYQFEVGIQNAIASNKVDMAQLESADEATRLDALFKLHDMTLANLNTQLQFMPEKLKTIAMMGEGYMYQDESGQFVLTDKGNLTLLATLKDATNYKATYASVDDFARHVMSSENATESVKSIYRNFLRQNGQEVASSEIDMTQALNHAYNIMGFANTGGAQTSSGAVNSPFQVGQAVDPNSDDFVRMREQFQSSGQNEMQTPGGAVFSYDGTQIIRVR